MKAIPTGYSDCFSILSPNERADTVEPKICDKWRREGVHNHLQNLQDLHLKAITNIY